MDFIVRADCCQELSDESNNNYLFILQTPESRKFSQAAADGAIVWFRLPSRVVKDVLVSYAAVAAVMTFTYQVGTTLPFMIFSLFTGLAPVLLFGAIFYLTPIAALTFGICKRRYGIVAGCLLFLLSAYVGVAATLSANAAEARAFERRGFARVSIDNIIIRLPEEPSCDALCLRLLWDSGAPVAVKINGWQIWRKAEGSVCQIRNDEIVKAFPDQTAESSPCAVVSIHDDVDDSLEIRGSDHPGYQGFRYRTKDERPTNFSGKVYELYEHQGRREELLGRWISGKVSSMTDWLTVGLFPGPFMVGDEFSRADFYQAVAKHLNRN